MLPRTTSPISWAMIPVIVCTGWLDETVEILKKHPNVSVGVHVCLNSEWVPYKWGPVLSASEVPTLVDEWGHFFGTRKDLMAHHPNLDEVEKEIRAQVDLAIRKGLKISYMDHHMSAAVTTPEMRERFVKVANEKGLAISRWFGEMPGPLVYSIKPDAKLDFLVDGLQKLTNPGLYLIVCHTAIKTPEIEVLNDLNASGPHSVLPLAPGVAHFYLDVTGDALVAPLDVLQIVNFLNAAGNSAAVASLQ